MVRSLDVGRVAVWRRRFERFHKAGLSVARFCEREGVSVPSFYLWRKKLAAGDKSPDSGTARQAFAPVRLLGVTTVAVRLPGGTRIEIPLGDPRTPELLEWLRQVDAQQVARGMPAGGDAC